MSEDVNTIGKYENQLKIERAHINYLSKKDANRQKELEDAKAIISSQQAELLACKEEMKYLGKRVEAERERLQRVLDRGFIARLGVLLLGEPK